MRTIVLLFALVVPLPVAAQSECPTTASSNPARFFPPAPHHAVLEHGMFWHGSERLFVQLNEDGKWHGLYRADLKAYRNKLPLYRSGFDWRRERKPPISVTATRLDTPAPIVMAEGGAGSYNEDSGSMIMTALDLPAGCWQINSRYVDEPPLTFVVSVP
jgi:hypothetical protein